jgi:hypothetical protein
MERRLHRLRAGLAGLSLLSLCALAQAQILPGKGVRNVDTQKLANGIVGLMTYMVTPDVTTSSLSIANASGDSNDLMMTQLGGGFTLSKETPLYMEGNAAYARFDPVFIASDGATTRTVPTKWNTLAVTIGIGWDFPIAPRWILRPIVNLTYGEVKSDMGIAKWWIENNTEADIAFLDNGKIKTYGAGGSLMLDYELFSEGYDDDLEVRYTNVQLSSKSDAGDVKGHARAESLSVWARRRIPTGWGHMLDRPVRYVLEGAYTRFMGAEKETGLNQLSSVGLGLELDTSAKDIWVTRVRLVGRYRFGPGVHGYSVGLAASF